MGKRASALETLVTLPDPRFWAGKRVLLTGHSGFKGGWLALWLAELGCDVTGYSLPPATEPALFEALSIQTMLDSHFGELADYARLKTLVRHAEPEIVFHLAAQPLVRAGYADPLGTFGTNVIGTANVLDALRGVSSVRAVVAVTTDKVYHNDERPHAYGEDDQLGGHDPYSASKAASELIIASYRQAFLADQGVALASARAGNVIGGGDWSEDRLIPDAVRAWSNSTPLAVRRPAATRPWQHVLEPLNGYLRLAELLWTGDATASAYNFGPGLQDVADVRSVIELARQSFGTGEVEFASSAEGPHEAGQLALNADKARRELGVNGRWPLTVAVDRTMRWYAGFAAGQSARDLCLSDLASYQAA